MNVNYTFIKWFIYLSEENAENKGIFGCMEGSCLCGVLRCYITPRICTVAKMINSVQVHHVYHRVCCSRRISFAVFAGFTISTQQRFRICLCRACFTSRTKHQFPYIAVIEHCVSIYCKLWLYRSRVFCI